VPAAEPVILCPLEFERRLLQRAGLSTRLRLFCCGPGPRAVERWLAARRPPDPVILCGLAGSVRASYPARSAFVAGAVVTDDGQSLEPTLGSGGGPAPLIGSADATLTTPDAKRAWAADSGADLVDRESAAFARAASESGRRWAVVRGVSDGPESTLPAGIDGWLDARGRTRAGTVLRAVATGRVSARQLIRLRADSVAAMRAAAVVVRRMLEEEP
jgi:hypothetical protein